MANVDIVTAVMTVIAVIMSIVPSNATTDITSAAASVPNGMHSRSAVASVRAPLTPPWPTPGASWYPIEGLNGRDPDAVTRAAEALLEWIAEHLGGRPVGLLGFSQGGAVAIQTLRVAPEAVQFAVVLAGYAAGGELPGDAVLAERRPPVFWGRGSRDDVIPPALIDMTAQWLPTHSELTGRVYPGLTHSVSEEELADVRAFLDARLAARSTASEG